MKITPILSLATAAILAACSELSLNEGAVRASYAPPPTDAERGETLAGIVYADGQGGASKAEIAPGEHFQITLVSAFICDFRETGDLPQAVDASNENAVPCAGGTRNAGSPRQNTRGEIAITAGFAFRGVDDAAGDALPRVIYFNDDVRESGQMLNMVNIPIYGPAKVLPAASLLKLEILELDEEEAKSQNALLGKLASLGKSFSGPGGGLAFDILSELGGALLAANQDDVEFRFDMGFDAPSANSALPRRPLSEGYLALVRKENRLVADHFDRLTVCPLQGFVTAGACADGKPYMGDTWLLLRISRESADAAEAELVGATLETLKRSGYLRSAASLQAASDAVEKIINAAKTSN